jgi:hypothetical protein
VNIPVNIKSLGQEEEIIASQIKPRKNFRGVKIDFSGNACGTREVK